MPLRNTIEHGSQAPENLCRRRRPWHGDESGGPPARWAACAVAANQRSSARARPRLFDRVGRRLILTAQGEQLLGDCRRVLTDLDRVREQAYVLRRGDSGTLKVLAPPHTIESVLCGFLPRYAENFPHVHVEVTEALGPEQPALLERGEAHVGIRLDPGVHPLFETRVLQSADVL